MDSKFLKDTCCRSDRIRSAEERKIGLLCSSEKSPCCCLVACYVSIQTLRLLGRFDAVCVRNSLDIGCIIETILKDLLVRLHKLRLLLSELTLQILEDVLHRTVVDVTSHSKGKHVLTFLYGLLIKTAVFETLMSKSCDRSYDDSSVFDMKLGDRILTKTGSLQAFLIEGIGIHEHHSGPLQPFCVCLQGGRIHSHQQVTEVTWSCYLLATDMNLKT